MKFGLQTHTLFEHTLIFQFHSDEISKRFRCKCMSVFTAVSYSYIKRRLQMKFKGKVHSTPSLLSATQQRVGTQEKVKSKHSKFEKKEVTNKMDEMINGKDKERKRYK